MRLVFVIAVFLFGQSALSPVLANVRFNLSARVIPKCEIIDQNDVSRNNQLQLNISTACNTEFFRFRISGMGQGGSWIDAESDHAQINLMPGQNEASVRLFRPGRQLFRLTMTDVEVQSNLIRIEVRSY